MASQSKSQLDKGKQRADSYAISFENYSQEEMLSKIDRELGDVSSILDIDVSIQPYHHCLCCTAAIKTNGNHSAHYP